jgi:hypothetical protein
LPAGQLHGDQRVEIEISLDADRVRVVFDPRPGARQGGPAAGERGAEERRATGIGADFPSIVEFPDDEAPRAVERCLEAKGVERKAPFLGGST